MTRNGLITDWDRFVESVKSRFGPSKYEDPQGVLSKLLQLGLNFTYKRNSRPTTLGDAFGLARITDAHLEGQTAALTAEGQERLNKGLCFNCDNRWTRGYKCSGKFLLLITKEEDDMGAATGDGGDDAVESGDISILNSLIGHGSPRSLPLWEKLGKGNVYVLNYNGSTHNFIRLDVVEKMCLPIKSTKAFKVYIGSGESLLCESVCSSVTLHMQGVGKENGVNILKSIDEGPFQIGTFRETLAEGTEGALGPKRPRVYSDLSPEDKERQCKDAPGRFGINQRRPGITTNIKMTMSRMQLNSMFVNNMLPEWGRFVTAVKLNRGLRDSNYDQLYAYLKQHEAHANENKMMLDRFTQHTVDPLALMSNGRGAAGYGGAQKRVGNANLGQSRQIKCYNYNGICHIAKNCTQPKRPQNSEYFKDKMLLMQAQENGVTLDEEQLLFIAGGQDNAIDEDVDEQPVQDLALNVDNVFQADDCDAFNSDVDKAPMAQTMFIANLSSADPWIVIETYDQYVKDNAVPVVQSNVSSVPNDAYMMIYNDMYEPHAQSVSKTTRNTVVDNSLTAELATYKEQVKLYERRARFELTEREQKIDEQLRIVITDRNIKEENLKKELHSVKLQLASTINHNKSMVEEVTSLKKDFKQKENKYLEEFLDMKALKEKVEDKLYKQDQSL
ncbi:hypothetical protein Tco_0217225 [Tanacetum coccineum]